MATLNRVFLVGRLTRNPETRTFANGGKVAQFGFAVSDKKRNQQTGELEDSPVFMDVEAFNGKIRPLADQAEKYFTKGKQLLLEGRLQLDQWTGQDGSKRSKLKIVLDNFQFLDPPSEYKKSQEQSQPKVGASTPSAVASVGDDGEIPF